MLGTFNPVANGLKETVENGLKETNEGFEGPNHHLFQAQTIFFDQSNPFYKLKYMGQWPSVFFKTQTEINPIYFPNQIRWVIWTIGLTIISLWTSVSLVNPCINLDHR
jgi:hypothetical protein